MKRVVPVVVLAAAAFLAGCASRADSIAAAYVSPLPYQQLTCEQLASEAERVSSAAAIAAGAQNKQASNDAVATTVAVVLFWPAAFLVKGDSAHAAEVSRLKGEASAIEQASRIKNCGISFQVAPAKPQ